MLLLLSHAPRMVSQASFYAEDAAPSYPDAYRLEWHALLLPVVGYLQTFPRLIALATLPFPLHWAPTLIAPVVFAVQMLVALFLIGPRMRDAWPSPVGRLLLCGLTGPFASPLAPIAVWGVRRRWSSDAVPRIALLRAAVVLACAALQGSLVVSHLQGRSHESPGATPWLFVRILSNQVFFASLVGQHGLIWMQLQSILQAPALAGLIAVAGLMLWALAWVKGSTVLRRARLRPVSSSSRLWPHRRKA